MALDRTYLLADASYRTSRSSGKGGQHVNKTETKVELLFPVQDSALLTETERQRLLVALAHRIDNQGVLHLVCEGSRSQGRNKEECQERFLEEVSRALRPRKKRIATRPGKAAREKRLKSKKHRSEVKQWRKKDRY